MDKNKEVKINFRTPLTPRMRVSIDFKDSPSMTKQEFKRECDINNIMARYLKTGIIDHVNKFQGDYADLGTPCDFQTAQNILIEAEDAFASLPSKIRKRFDNNPGEFLAFVQDPGNEQEMRELGLLKPEPPKPPEKAPEPPKAKGKEEGAGAGA